MNPPQADHGYGRPLVDPQVSAPATYHWGTPRLRSRISDLGFLTTLMILNLTVQISPFVLWFLRSFQQIFIPQSAIHIPRSSTRWPARPSSWSRDSNSSNIRASVQSSGPVKGSGLAPVPLVVLLLAECTGTEKSFKSKATEHSNLKCIAICI